MEERNQAFSLETASISPVFSLRAEPRTTRGGQPWYSPLAILTALTLRAVFRLAVGQTEGLIGSIIHLLGLTLAVPDHSTLSRRAETLEVPRPRPHRDGEPVHLLVDSTGLKLCGAGKAGQGSNRVARGTPAEIPCCGSSGKKGIRGGFKCFLGADYGVRKDQQLASDGN